MFLPQNKKSTKATGELEELEKMFDTEPQNFEKITTKFLSKQKSKKKKLEKLGITFDVLSSVVGSSDSDTLKN